MRWTLVLFIVLPGIPDHNFVSPVADNQWIRTNLLKCSNGPVMPSVLTVPITAVAEKASGRAIFGAFLVRFRR